MRPSYITIWLKFVSILSMDAKLGISILNPSDFETFTTGI